MSSHLINNTHTFLQESEEYLGDLESMKTGPLPGQISVLWLTPTLEKYSSEHWSFKVVLGGLSGEEENQPRLLD